MPGAIFANSDKAFELWLQEHEKILQELDSQKANTTSEFARLERKVKEHLRSSIRSRTNDSVRKLVVKQIYESIRDNEIPFSYIDQGEEIRVLLLPWSPASSKEAEHVVYEIGLILTIHSTSSSPLPESEIQKGVGIKITRCGSHRECFGGEYLFRNWLSMIARSSGRWDETREQSKKASLAFVRSEAFPSGLDSKKYVEIHGLLTEFQILSDQSKVSESVSLALKIQEKTDAVFYNKAIATGGAFAVGNIRTGWVIDEQILTKLKGLGQDRLVESRAATLLTKYLNPVMLRGEDEERDLRFISRKVKRLIVGTNKENETSDEIRTVSLNEYKSNFGSLFWGAFSLITRESFDGSDLMLVNSLLDRALDILKMHKNRSDEWISPDIEKLVNGLRLLAQAKVNQPEARGQLEAVFWEKHLPALAIISFFGEPDFDTALKNFAFFLS